jgi:hypothetical protein
MKKFLPYILILTILLSGALTPVVSSAQSPNPDPNAPAVGSAGAGTPPDTSKSCISLTSFSFTACVAMVGNILMWLFARALYFSGALMDLSLKFSLNISDLVNQTTIINVGWQIFRDLANVVFIFLILWLAIGTILGLQQDTMKSLTRIILAALLINFSLFITKAVIDAANIFALHFFSLLVPDGGGSLAGVFMSGLRLSTVYNSAAIGQSIGFGQVILVTFFGSILILVSTYVFLAAAVMFLIRTVILIILMILSPIAFVSWVIPGMSGHTSKWWNTLFSQAFFAPAYMAMAYVVGKAIQSPSGGLIAARAGETSSFAAALATSAPDPGVAGLLLNFILLIGMMVACLIVAGKIGAVGSSTMMSWGKQIQGAGTGLIGRSAVRNLGLKVKEGGLIDRAAKRIGLKNVAGEYTLRRADEKLKHSTWASTAIGSKVRDLTTGYLVTKAKFGGHTTAEEAHRETLEEKSEREEKEKRDELIKLVNQSEKDGKLDDPKIQDEIQRRLAQMTTEFFVRLPKEFLRNDKVMKFATTAQMSAVWGSKEFSEQEKKQFFSANQKDFFQWEEACRRLNKFNDAIAQLEKNIYNKWQNNENTDDELRTLAEMEVERKKLADDADLNNPKNKDLYRKVRDYGMPTISRIHWTNPDVFQTKQVLDLMRYGTIQQIQSAEDWTFKEKQIIRDLKLFETVEANDRIEGIKDLPTNMDIDKFKEQFENLTAELGTLTNGLWGNLKEARKNKDAARIDELTRQIAAIGPEAKNRVDIYAPLVELYERLSGGGNADKEAALKSLTAEGWRDMLPQVRRDIKGLSALAYERFLKDYKDRYEMKRQAARTAGQERPDFEEEQAAAGKELDVALGNRASSEFGYIPGRVYQRHQMLKRYGNNALSASTMKDKDTKDLKIIIDFEMESVAQALRNLQDRDVGEPLSDAVKTSLRWLFHVKEGQNYYSGPLDDSRDLLADAAGQRARAELERRQILAPGQIFTAKLAREILRDARKGPMLEEIIGLVGGQQGGGNQPTGGGGQTPPAGGGGQLPQQPPPRGGGG